MDVLLVIEEVHKADWSQQDQSSNRDTKCWNVDLHLISGNRKRGEESNNEEGDHFSSNTGLRDFGTSEFERQSLSSHPDVYEDRVQKEQDNQISFFFFFLNYE